MTEPSPSLDFHGCVAAAQRAAEAVVQHHHHPHQPVWRQWFGAPREEHLVDKARHFISVLDDVLDTPPEALSRADLAELGKQINRVIDRIEARIEHANTPDMRDVAPFSAAIYVIRARFEDISQRGAGR